MPFYEDWAPYVPVRERKRRAQAQLGMQKRQGAKLQPVQIAGSTIAKSFWGRAWCQNLESYSDFENRLPRGRSYVRSGAVIDLRIQAGVVAAQVQGRDLYRVQLDIKAVAPSRWQDLRTRCIGSLASLVDLLSGRLPPQVMSVVTDRRHGLFPSPAELQMSCSCPDWATMCKHVAATLYAVGARLDSEPELLFTLRGVDPTELILQASSELPHAVPSVPDVLSVQASDLGALFGIELSHSIPPSHLTQADTDKPDQQSPASESPPTREPAQHQSPSRATTAPTATAPTPTARGFKKPRTAGKGAQQKAAVQFSDKEKIAALKKLLARLKKMEKGSARRAR